jgi:hypothetical protein
LPVEPDGYVKSPERIIPQKPFREAEKRGGQKGNDIFFLTSRREKIECDPLPGFEGKQASRSESGKGKESITY